MKAHRTASPALALRLLSALAIAGCASACTAEAVDEREPATTTLAGVVLDENHQPVGDVALCAFDDPDIPCVHAGADGRFALALPEGERRVVSYEAPDHVPTLYVHEGVGDAFRLVPLMTSAGYDNRFAPLHDIQSTGAISVHASGEAEGVEALLTPNLVPDPVYTDDDWYVLDGRGSTDDSGRAAFLRVTPGEHVVETRRYGTLCEPMGWDEENGGATVVVEAGYLTHVDVWCR